MPGSPLDTQGTEFFSNGIGGLARLPKLDDPPANAEFGLVGHKLPIVDGVPIGRYPAAIVFGVGGSVRTHAFADAHGMKPGQNYGLGNAELGRDLGGRKALFSVKDADLSVIEEFCREADLNEIN
jgi:hypothetical protein